MTDPDGLASSDAARGSNRRRREPHVQAAAFPPSSITSLFIKLSIAIPGTRGKLLKPPQAPQRLDESMTSESSLLCPEILAAASDEGFINPLRPRAERSVARVAASEGASNCVRREGVGVGAASTLKRTRRVFTRCTRAILNFWDSIESDVVIFLVAADAAEFQSSSSKCPRPS